MTLCANCNQPRELMDTGYCWPCQNEVEAKQPPQDLCDMRHVYQGKVIQTRGHQIFAGLLDKNPKEFLSMLRDYEKQWRETLARFQGETGEKEPVDELIEKLLEECKPDAVTG